MTLHLYSNLSINLDAAPLISFYKQENGNYTVKLGTESSAPLATAEKINELKAAIKDYNDAGGRYFWLFSNVAINLDMVSMLWRKGQQLIVEYPGGVWVSSDHDEAQAYYKQYLEYLDKENGDEAAPVAALAGKGAMPLREVDEEALAQALENIDRMTGLGNAKRDIRENIAVARFNFAKAEIGMPVKPISRHMVFTGNPGTGKTTFAREVAKIYHALGFLATDKVIEAKREDLVAEYTGQTAPKVQRKMEEARGGVLFIDEAYSLVRDRAAFRDSFGTEAIDTLVAGMENMRDELVVIVAGYPEPMRRFIAANEGLQSRFVTYISFDDYSMDELGTIMEMMAAERGHVFAPDARAYLLERIEGEKSACEDARADNDNGGSSFGNARTVRNLVEASEKALALRLDTQGLLRAGHGQNEQERKAALSTITLDDVKGLAPGGIRAIEVRPAAPVRKTVKQSSAPRG